MFESVVQEMYAKTAEANNSRGLEPSAQVKGLELHNQNLQDLFRADYLAEVWRESLISDKAASGKAKRPPQDKPAEEGIVAGDGVTFDAESGTVVIAEKGSVVTAFKGSHIYAKEGSRVTAHEGALVEVTGAADVFAKSGADIKLWDGAIVEAATGPCVHVTESDVKVEAFGSKIIVYKGTDVEAKKGSHVFVHQGATVYAYDGSKVSAKSGSTVVTGPKARLETERGVSIITRDSDAKLVIVGSWSAYGTETVAIKTNYEPERGQPTLFVKSRREFTLEYKANGTWYELGQSKPLEHIVDPRLRDLFPDRVTLLQGTFDSNSTSLKSSTDKYYNNPRSYEVVRLTPSFLTVRRDNKELTEGYARNKK